MSWKGRTSRELRFQRFPPAELLAENAVHAALKAHGHGEGGEENLKSTAENSL